MPSHTVRELAPNMERHLEIFRPYPANTLTQGFSENANILYKREGLSGHTAQDYGVPYGTQIPFCAEDSYVYSHINKDNKDPMRYRAVFTLVETETGIYEISYGHCSEITAEIGKTYRPGEFMGRVGNTGTVFVGNHEVTKEEKLAGSKAGAHLHGPQVRPVKKVKNVDKSKTYLYDQNGKFKKDGFYFEVIDYENGLNGCVDPRKFMSPYLAKDAQTVKLGQQKQIISLLQEWITLLFTKKR
jgi:murein DD-endopeptidase MepM/ murein hydrolase activator NlpD